MRRVPFIDKRRRLYMAAGKKRVAQALHGPLLGKGAGDHYTGFCLGVETGCLNRPGDGGRPSARLIWCKYVAINPDPPLLERLADGEGFRRLLLHTYGTVEAVEEVLALGFLQRLGVEHAGGPGHSLKRPQPGVTVAYHRDGGRELEAAFDVAAWPNCHESVYRRTARRAARVYVLTPGGWMVSDHTRRDWHEPRYLETPLERLGRLT